MNQAEVERLIEIALEPLKREIAELRGKLGGMAAPEIAPEPVQTQSLDPEQTQSLDPEQTQSLEPAAPPELEQLPPERSDFQRFLQRGLAEEQQKYSEEAVADKPEAKKGWNPFRR